jgi:hypothetical protein
MNQAKNSIDVPEFQFYENLHSIMDKTRIKMSGVDKQQMLEIVDKTMNSLHLIDLDKEIHKECNKLRFDQEIKATSDYIKDRREKIKRESKMK